MQRYFTCRWTFRFLTATFVGVGSGTISRDFPMISPSPPSQPAPIFTWLGHLTGEDEKWSIGVAASKEKNGNYDKSRDASMGWFFGWGKHLSTAREGGREK